MRRYGLSTVLSAASCVLGKIKPFCEIDDLTGVLNLRALRSDLAHFGDVAMALININGFSTVNNAYGVEAGDLLLKSFCKILLKNIPSNATVYRCYGDEFAVVFVTNSVSQAEEFAKQIKKMGCKLSVDDFGTEHSNFRRLLELEVDLIKIDGSFIKNLDKCDISRKIVGSVISFSRSIGAMTAAEFVHSKEIQNIVLDMGVDYSQGYHIGIPTSKVEIKLDEAFI